MTISLVGRAEAERRIKDCKELLNSEAVQDAILPAAQLIRDVAKRLVRLGPGIRTGKANRGEKRPHLRDLIFATKGRRRKKGILGAISGSIYDSLNGPSVIAGVDLKQSPHAHLVEYGHGGKSPAPARPFMRPAVASVRWAVVQIIESALKRMLAPFST
jgi:HK97 gp10 family phage protein